MKRKLLSILTAITLIFSLSTVPVYADRNDTPGEEENEEEEAECAHPAGSIIAYKDKVVAATFSSEGAYDVVFKCLECDQELSRHSYIIPKRTVNSTVIKQLKSSKKKQLTIKYSSVETCKGYELQYSTSKKFKSKKSVKIAKGTTSKTLTKLKSKKTYYIRIRAYYVENGKTYNSAWSNVKCKKIK